MRLCTFFNPQKNRLTPGLIHIDQVFEIPFTSVMELIENGVESLFPFTAKEISAKREKPFPLSSLHFAACLPNPKSFRDFFAFEAHIRNARAKRGLTIPNEWYDFPAFYFSNHQAIQGPVDPLVKPIKTQQLDYELEVGCVIGKVCRNVPLSEARQVIAGYTLLCDWSLRDVQLKEIAVGLGPAKGKDFATSLGRELLTPDEFGDRLTYLPDGRSHLDLELSVSVNGTRYGGGNFNSIYFSFEEMIVRASEDVTLYPGDLIGSGTIGTGCLLELDNEHYPYLQIGDTVELNGGILGNITATIVAP